MDIEHIPAFQIKEKQMGHKGVSKRKPKKSNSVANGNNNNSVNTRSDFGSSVQALVKDKAVVDRAVANPAAGANRKPKGK